MCLDVMIRDINKILWTFTTIGICNDMDQVCVGCEGIFCGERELTCLFVVQLLLMGTPSSPEYKVYSVVGNCFFNQVIVERFGFTNAKFVADYFHLFDLDKKVIFFVVRHY